MKNLFTLTLTAIFAVTSIGCSDSETAPKYPENKNVMPAYQELANGDYSPVICISDSDHTWYKCVLKNGEAQAGGKVFSTWTAGGIWVQNRTWTGGTLSEGINITIDNYGGDVVGSQADESSPIYFAVLPEGTMIDDNLSWVQNSGYNQANFFRAPHIWSVQSPEVNKGQSGYIVGKFSYKDENGANEGYYRGWLKVSVGNNGSVKFGGMYVCIGDGDFRAGQTR